MNTSSKTIFIEIIEWTGSLMILLGYFCIIQGILQTTDLSYLLINIFASVFLTTSLITKKAYATSTLQIAFIAISLWGIVKYFGIFS